MVEYEKTADLDQTFAALADPTRRALLNRLRDGPSTVGALAAPFDVSLNAVSKHLRVLERAQLVRREVRGREHHLHLNAAPLRDAVAWTAGYRDFWEQRLDALERLLAKAEPSTGRKTK
jgi:DNA-binding transcriptional ArsR family regulator